MTTERPTIASTLVSAVGYFGGAVLVLGLLAVVVFGWLALAAAGVGFALLLLATVARCAGLLDDILYEMRGYRAAGQYPPQIMKGPAFGREWHVGGDVVRAEFVRVHRGQFVLRRQDGRVFSCEPQALSAADRQHVSDRLNNVQNPLPSEP